MQSNARQVYQYLNVCKRFVSPQLVHHYCFRVADLMMLSALWQDSAFPIQSGRAWQGSRVTAQVYCTTWDYAKPSTSVRSSCQALAKPSCNDCHGLEPQACVKQDRLGQQLWILLAICAPPPPPRAGSPLPHPTHVQLYARHCDSSCIPCWAHAGAIFKRSI